MQRINYVLQQKLNSHIGWLLCGVLFCCCTLSCSLWPLVCLSRRVSQKSQKQFNLIFFQAVVALEKALDYENQQLYNRLGFHWKLSRKPMEHNLRLTEYVLLLETLPRIPLMLPD